MSNQVCLQVLLTGGHPITFCTLLSVFVMRLYVDWQVRFSHEAAATVLCHAEMGTDCPMYHFMVAELRLKVKTFTTLVTLKGFIQVSVHVFFKGPW